MLCDAILAQLVEQLICNQQVVGSSPTNGSIKKSPVNTAFAGLVLFLLYPQNRAVFTDLSNILIACLSNEKNKKTPYERYIETSQTTERGEYEPRVIYNGDRTVKYEILSYELIDDKETRISLFFMDFNTRITTFPKLFDGEPRQKLHCYVVFAEKMIYNPLG